MVNKEELIGKKIVRIRELNIEELKYCNKDNINAVIILDDETEIYSNFDVYGEHIGIFYNLNEEVKRRIKNENKN